MIEYIDDADPVRLGQALERVRFHGTPDRGPAYREAAREHSGQDE
jgi:hypothetical protein